MVQQTSNYSLQYPEAGDQVSAYPAVAKTTAERIDAALAAGLNPTPEVGVIFANQFDQTSGGLLKIGKLRIINVKFRAQNGNSKRNLLYSALAEADRPRFNVNGVFSGQDDLQTGTSCYALLKSDGQIELTGVTGMAKYSGQIVWLAR